MNLFNIEIHMIKNLRDIKIIFILIRDIYKFLNIKNKNFIYTKMCYFFLLKKFF